MKVKDTGAAEGGKVLKLPRRKRRPGRALVLAAAIVLACVALPAAIWRIDTVRVTGVTYLRSGAVLQAADLGGGDRILLTRLSSVRRRVEALPSVRFADVSRRLPGTVIIAVTERAPLVVLNGAPHLAADVEGRLFPVPGGAVLPVLDGWTGRAAPGRVLTGPAATVLKAYSSFPAGLRERSARVVVQPKAVQLVLTSGTVVEFGAPAQLSLKAAAAWSVVADAEQTQRSLERVDVRVPRTPVSRERPPATPVPTPSATP